MKLYRTNGELIGEGKTLREIVEANKSNLRGSDLRGLDLHGSDLRGLNLCGSDLRGSDLRGSDLRGSDLRYSNLRGSNLRYSNLCGSDLRGSDLRYSDLRGSDLRYSNLRGSDLRYSNLRGSNLCGTGCVQMRCGPWFIWITPERCRIGCQNHPHKFWHSATPESVASMHDHASDFWSLWGEMILAVCRACAKHGWPVLASDLPSSVE